MRRVLLRRSRRKKEKKIMWKRWMMRMRRKAELKRMMKRLMDMQIRLNRETMRMEQIQNKEGRG